MKNHMDMSLLVIKWIKFVRPLQIPFQVTPFFRDEVKSLPTVPGPEANQAYRDFISVYGTHYTREVTMGAKAVIRSEVSYGTLRALDHLSFAH